MVRTADLVHATAFPVAAMLGAAVSDAARAAMLLRLPDEVVWQTAGELTAALADAGFRAGVSYLMVRVAAAAAVPGEDGLLPELVREQLEAWRLTLVDIAGSGR